MDIVDVEREITAKSIERPALDDTVIKEEKKVRKPRSQAQIDAFDKARKTRATNLAKKKAKELEELEELEIHETQAELEVVSDYYSSSSEEEELEPPPPRRKPRGRPKGSKAKAKPKKLTKKQREAEQPYPNYPQPVQFQPHPAGDLRYSYGAQQQPQPPWMMMPQQQYQQPWMNQGQGQPQVTNYYYGEQPTPRSAPRDTAVEEVETPSTDEQEQYQQLIYEDEIEEPVPQLKYRFR